MKEIHILLVDDQILFIESLKGVLEFMANDIKIDAIAHNGKEAIDCIKKHKPDIILMDVRMPEVDGVEATKIIHNSYPDINIIMLTTFDDDDYVYDALQNGAVGYLLKDIPPQELITSIRAVNNGSVLISPSVAEKLIRHAQAEKIRKKNTPEGGKPAWFYTLSNREKEVLQHIVNGLRNKDIAERMFIAEQTLRNHVSSIYAKLGENNRYHLIEKVKKIFISAGG